jgi:cytochrome c oxidase cbb3-type subunit 4
MTPAWGVFAGIVTLFLMIVFLAIWAWAWLPHHKGAFDEWAKLPMNDREDGR